MSSVSSLPKLPKASSTSTPVVALDTTTAKFFTHLHPVLVVSAFFLQFNGLVADPVLSLPMSLVVTAIFQFAYVVTCLPAAGAKARNGPKNALKAASRRKPGSSSKGAEGIVANLPAALLSLLLALVVGTPVLLIMMILFGAPLTTHLSHTTLTAAHLALLAVMPLAYVHGVDAQRWREIASAMMPQDEVYGATVGTLVGAWLGAVPIPLDWDREWQKWPVTIITGAYIGFATGKLLGEFVFRGRVIEFD